jgi:hypothetical protein
MMKNTLLEKESTSKTSSNSDISFKTTNSKVPEKKTHSPNLDTIKMIEDTIEENHDFRTVTELYHSLPRKVQHATFKTVLVYLEQSNKIAYDKNGAVFWIFVGNKQGLIDLEKNSVSLR